MRLEFEYGWPDVREAYVAVNKKLWIKAGIIIGLIIAFNLGLVLLARLAASAQPGTTEAPSFARPLIIFGVFLLLWIPLISFMRGGSAKRKYWREHPWYQRPKVVEATAESIIFYDLYSRLEFRWPNFIRFRETKHLFCLYHCSTSMYIVPKSARFHPRWS